VICEAVYTVREVAAMTGFSRQTVTGCFRDDPMKILTIAVVLMALTGCDSGRDAKLQEDQRDVNATMKAQQDDLQWRLDDAVAAGIFDEIHYRTFRKCHEEPPAHDANKKACIDLQTRVAKQEATNKAKADKEKAAW
jgi:hypothetical protein